MRTFQSIVIACFIFLLGTLAGALLTSKILQLRVQGVITGGPAAVARIITTRMGSKLKLDKIQKQQLLVIVQDAQNEVQNLRMPIEPSEEKILEAAEARMRTILRQDQIAGFEEFVAKSKADLESFQNAAEASRKPAETRRPR